MSMEDIFKVLVDSRQQGGASQSSNQDAMGQLIGGLLGGQSNGASQSNSQDAMSQLIGGLLGGSEQAASNANAASDQGAGLGDMMGMLEGIIGGQQEQGNDPMMAMLQPFVNQLAQKMKISPAIATIVVSFVAHKLLAHHPTSGRDSNQFNLDNLISSGDLSTNTLKSSGMVKELSKATGLNEQASAQNLDAAFKLLGGVVKNMAAR